MSQLKRIKKIDITISSIEDRVLIQVKDNGEGIPKEIRDDILKKRPISFGKKEGSGIGLSYASLKSPILGGNISFETQEAKGTNFSRNPQI